MKHILLPPIPPLILLIGLGLGLVQSLAACSKGPEGGAGNPAVAENATQPGARALPPTVNTATAATGHLPEGSVRLQRVQVMDRQGFDKPMVATTVLVPVGWQTQGGVVWGHQPQCSSSGYTMDFQAYSRDGLFGVHVFPGEQWQWSNQAGTPSTAGCPTLQITSIRQYLEAMTARARPGAQILDFRARPDIAQPLKQLEQYTPMPLGDMRTWVEAAEVLIGYQHEGRAMRETVAAAAVFSLMRMQGMAGMPSSEFLTGVTLPGFAMRAPDGELDFRLAELIRRSGQPNPQWQARIAQHNAKIASINLKGAQQRSQIIAQTGEEIRQMQADSWRKQSQSFDYLSRESSEAIRGVETYDDPYHGGTVQLDNSYRHAWQLNDGTYVLTDDTSFDPYAVLGQDGQQLRPSP